MTREHFGVAEASSFEKLVRDAVWADTLVLGQLVNLIDEFLGPLLPRRVGVVSHFRVAATSALSSLLLHLAPGDPL